MGALKFPHFLKIINRWHLVIAALFFTGFTVIMTWPLVQKMDAFVPGLEKTDNVYYVWLIGWFQKAIFELRQNPLFVPYQNWPFGWNLAYSEISLSNVLFALPFSLLKGPVFAYNFTLLASYVLSGLIVYWWVVSMTGNRSAGLIAGAIFAFAPYRIAHVNGHLPLMATQWLALHFAGLFSLFLQKIRGWRYSILAGLGLGLASLSSMYYLYMQIIITPIIVVGFLFFFRKTIFNKDLFLRLFVYIMTALPFLFIAVKPYLDLVSLGEQNRQPYEVVDKFSASLSDFFLPFINNPIWGAWISSRFGGSYWIESSLSLGVITIILSVMAIFLSKKQVYIRRIIWVLVCGALWAIALAMGTSFHWFGNRVLIQTPFFLTHWIKKPEIFIPMIGYFLYKYLPYYDGMRGWMRYGVFAILFFSIMAGIGFALLSSKMRRPIVYYAGMILALTWIGVEFLPSFSFSSTQFRPVDTWLNAQPGTGGVAQFPSSRMVGGDVIYGTLAYNKPYLGMFYGSYLPKNFKAKVPVLNKFPDKASLMLLRNRNIQYVIVDSSAFSNWPQIRQQILDLGLVEKGVFGNDYAYELGKTP